MRKVRGTWGWAVGAMGISVAALAPMAGEAPAGGSLAPAPAKLVAEAVRNLSRAATYTLRGDVVEGSGRYVIDVRAAGHGAKAAGTLSLGSTKPGAAAQTFSFVELGSRFYVRGNEAFWIAEGKGQGLPKVVMKRLANRWVGMPSAQVRSLTASVSQFTHASRLASGLLDTGHDHLSLGSTATIGGVRVRAIVDKSAGGVLYVTATGEVLPVELVGRQPRNGGRLVFGYGASTTIRAPAGAVSLVGLVVAALKG